MPSQAPSTDEAEGEKSATTIATTSADGEVTAATTMRATKAATTTRMRARDDRRPAEQRPDALRGSSPERGEAEPLAERAGRDLDHHDALQERARHERDRHGHEHEQDEPADGASDDRVGVGARGPLDAGEHEER